MKIRHLFTQVKIWWRWSWRGDAETRRWQRWRWRWWEWRKPPRWPNMTEMTVANCVRSSSAISDLNNLQLSIREER
ncbi:hypothetical protein HanIR_Chr03g0124811 [Helianthus annuus]|nr:hypothetical protein HanIR_Chr03g0124811 [Helianthus annuus]